MPRTTSIITLCLLLLGWPERAIAQNEVVPDTPEGARLITEDVGRFAALLDSLPSVRDTAAAFDSLYLERASPGLQAYLERFRLTGQDYTEAIRRRPLFFRSLADNWSEDV